MRAQRGAQGQFRFGEHQRVWESMPPRVRGKAGELLQEIYLAEFRTRRLVLGVKSHDGREDHS